MRRPVLLALMACLALAGCGGLATGAAHHHGSLADVNSLKMLDADHGWAFGYSLVARTSDGVKTLVDVTPPQVTATTIVDGAFFLDPTRAWVWIAPRNGSSPATLERTSDGGATWQATGFRTAHDGGVTFIDSDHGWMISGESVVNHTALQNTLWRTTDGGRNWSVVDQRTHKLAIQPNVQAGECEIGEIGWTSTVHGLAGLECPFDAPPTVDVTDDGGALWTQATLPALPALKGVSLFAGVGPMHVFGHGQLATVVSRCVGPDPTSCLPYGKLYRSGDGGASWTSGAVAWGLEDVQMPDRDHAFASNGCQTDHCDSPGLLVTSDGGASWQRLSLPQSLWPNLHSDRIFQFVSPMVGFALATSPSIGMGSPDPATYFKTTDGGHTFNVFVPILV